MLSEMEDAEFDEWIAFDRIEPLDPAGAILAGLSSKSDKPAGGSSWQKQMATMRFMTELQKLRK